MRWAQPIEVYTVTPVDILGAFAVGLLVVGLAMAGMWWALHTPPVDDPEATVEIRPARRSRRRRPHTGVVHEPVNRTVDLSEVLAAARGDGGDR